MCHTRLAKAQSNIYRNIRWLAGAQYLAEPVLVLNISNLMKRPGIAKE